MNKYPPGPNGNFFGPGADPEELKKRAESSLPVDDQLKRLQMHVAHLSADNIEIHNALLDYATNVKWLAREWYEGHGIEEPLPHNALGTLVRKGEPMLLDEIAEEMKHKNFVPSRNWAPFKLDEKVAEAKLPKPEEVSKSIAAASLAASAELGRQNLKYIRTQVEVEEHGGVRLIFHFETSPGHNLQVDAFKRAIQRFVGPSTGVEHAEAHAFVQIHMW